MTAAHIPLADIIADADTQARVCEDARTIDEYAAVLRNDPNAMPPVVVYRDGAGCYLADGFHRLAAAKAAGLDAIRAEIRKGGREDARLAACAANATHGLRRTNADKRRAVEACLGLRPEWSDRQVARHCGVDHKTVGKYRAAWGSSPLARVGMSLEEAEARLHTAPELREWAENLLRAFMKGGEYRKWVTQVLADAAALRLT